MIVRGIITSLLVVALTLISFGHQTLSPKTEAQAQAYILAGGDWADLCGDAGDPLAHVTKCMACVISQLCAVPTPSDVARPLNAGTALAWVIVLERNPAPAAHSTQSARAPPVRLT
ncbi:MAG: hypothetical protein AAF801_04390 [Pseudomonadota bacterium]